MKNARMIAGTLSLISLVMGFSCAKKEDKKDIDDFLEEERMRQAAESLVRGIPVCTSTQAAVRFNNTTGMTTQGLSLYSGAACTGQPVPISADIAAGTVSAYVCVASTGYQPGSVDGTTCGATAFLFTAGHTYTVSSAMSGGLPTYFLDEDR